jgi:hypothetical protein
MWRKKKFILGLLVMVLLTSISLGGVALARGNDEDSQSDSLIARVAEILGIDQQSVEDAFSQAREEMRDEALDEYLQNMVDEGTITEAQAAEYKDWLKSRPDMEEYRTQMKEWFESRPDIPDEIEGNRYGGFRSRGGMGGFNGLNLPSQ